VSPSHPRRPFGVVAGVEAVTLFVLLVNLATVHRPGVPLLARCTAAPT
jgi:hypothetical protein